MRGSGGVGNRAAERREGSGMGLGRRRPKWNWEIDLGEGSGILLLLLIKKEFLGGGVLKWRWGASFQWSGGGARWKAAA